MLPFDQVFTSAFPNFPFSPFRILTVLLAMLFWRYNVNRLKPFKIPLFLFFFYCIISFFSVLWANDKYEAFLYSIQITIMLLFTIVTIFELSKDSQIVTKLSFYASIAGGILSLMAVFGFFSEGEIMQEHRLSFAGIGVNAVAISIGYTFILSISFLVVQKQKRLKKIFVLFASIVMLYFLIRTGTRSGIIGAVLALGIAFFFSYSIRPRHLLVFLVFSSIMYFSFNYIINNYINERIAERILSVGLENVKENSRLSIWEEGLEWYSNNILGAGAGNEDFVFKNNPLVKEAHNIFISSLFQLGIPGILIVSIAIIYIFSRIKKSQNIQYKFIAYSIYFFLLIQMMKGSFLQNRIFWIPLAIVIIIIRVEREINFIHKKESHNIRPVI